jgi:hypothetical protein
MSEDWSDDDNLLNWHNERGSDLSLHARATGVPDDPNAFSSDDAVSDHDDLQHDTSFVHLESDSVPDAMCPLSGREALAARPPAIQYSPARSGSGASLCQRSRGAAKARRWVTSQQPNCNR